MQNFSANDKEWFRALWEVYGAVVGAGGHIPGVDEQRSVWRTSRSMVDAIRIYIQAIFQADVEFPAGN